jgi:hypothetical protein
LALTIQDWDCRNVHSSASVEGETAFAIANRFVVLTLRQSWLGRENPALTDELVTELPGILGWVLDGLERLNARGRFTEPMSSTDAIMALADLVSPTSAFVRDRCVVGPMHEVLCDTLYSEWKGWAEDNGHRAGSVQTFGRDLRAALPGLRTKRPRDGDDRPRWFEGVSLMPTYSGSDRGPSRTGPETAQGPEPVERLVRDGPRPSPLWSRAAGATAAHAEPPVSVACSDYRAHQSAHRRVGQGWTCAACNSNSAAREPELPAPKNAAPHEPAEMRDFAAPLPEPDGVAAGEWEAI